MCGICGVASHWLSTGEIDGFKQLLVMSQLRGTDSTGVFGVLDPEYKAKRGKVFPYLYDKDTMNSSIFLSNLTADAQQKKLRDKLFSNRTCKVLVGHCRSATIGDVTPGNAHPFDTQNVIGVHNGTIRNFSNLKYVKDFKTDSEILYHNISELGIEETIKRIGYGGAYSLVYFDKQDGTLNFIRNIERPLYFAQSTGGDTMYWASEDWMLKGLASRRNTPFGKIFQLKPMELWSIGLTKTTNLFTEENLEHSEITLKTQQSWAPSSIHNRNDVEWNEGDTDIGEPQFEKPYKYILPVVAPVQRPLGLPDFVNHSTQGSNGNMGSALTNQTTPTPYKGFNNRLITTEEFQKALKHGCALCLETQNPDEPDIEYKVGWADPGLIICEDCRQANSVVDEWFVNNVVEKVINVG